MKDYTRNDVLMFLDSWDGIFKNMNDAFYGKREFAHVVVCKFIKRMAYHDPIPSFSTGKHGNLYHSLDGEIMFLERAFIAFMGQ